MLPIERLNPAEYNPRQLTEKQHADLTASIETFGLVDPIIINGHKARKNTVIGGHQRLRIAKELGIKTVPTVSVSLSQEKERELNIRLNRNTGEWDWDELANQFDIPELVDWGFTEKEVMGAFVHQTGDCKTLSSKKPARMVWALVGIEIERWNMISEVITNLQSVDGIFCEVCVNDKDG